MNFLINVIIEEISAADPAFCLSFGAHSSLFGNNLNVNGNHEQKERFLPRACAGTIIGGMCMSEADAGTDVMGMKSFAQPSSDGSHFTLNGTKMWISNGTIDGTDTGDVFLVYAKTDLKSKSGGLTSFIVEKGMPGFRLGRKITGKLGMRASNTAELIFEDVKIPAENVVGGVGGAAICMMRNLELERIGLAAMSLGIARRCIEVMSKYSQERKAFGKSIGEYGQIQKAIAESYAEYFAGRTYVYNFARQLDLKTYGNGLDADGVKLYCAPMAKRIADRAIQVLGGNGYVGEYQVERLWRDAKLLEIGGGTNEAHHKNMMRDLKKRTRID
jgi:isovaleryl-CoA dehydrogenase